MGGNDPVTKDECLVCRTNCKEVRTLENQNFLLTLHSEMNAELENVRHSMNSKIDEALARIGYEGDGVFADTAVPANRLDHPARRIIDNTLKGRFFAFIQRNAVSVLLVFLAVFASPQVLPYFHRFMEALTKMIEGFSK